MKTPIRILHLEDSPRDAAMIRDRLEADGLVCEITWVDTQKRFEAALAGEAFDLILCDYSLPGYHGLSALKLARERQPNAQVIMVSGSLSPEDAVACLKHGATDYLFKQRLERLAPALIRAIEEAEEHRERKRAEEMLREAERKYRDIVENAVEGIFQTTSDGRYLTANPALARMFGYDSPEELMAAITDIEHQLYVDPNRRAEFRRELETKNAVLNFESQVRRQDGRAIWISENAHAVRDGRGGIIRYEGMSQDVTVRKQAEEAIQQRAAELERFHRLSVGRELQMIELKKEVNELAKLAGRTPPYDLSFRKKE